MDEQVAKLGIKKVTLLYVQKYYSMSLATSINEVCKILEVSFVSVHVHVYENHSCPGIPCFSIVIEKCT